MARIHCCVGASKNYSANNGRVQREQLRFSSYAVNNCNFLYSNFLYTLQSQQR
ncbi:hypothetical protein [Muribaculum intestinale]|uniref:hypothetical protein n=1 Tax=Muribaculum intestinale TaxID=1796646 RepID=UPI003F66983B